LYSIVTSWSFRFLVLKFIFSILIGKLLFTVFLRRSVEIRLFLTVLFVKVNLMNFTFLQTGF
jgi:hypothetical protein